MNRRMSSGEHPSVAPGRPNVRIADVELGIGDVSLSDCPSLEMPALTRDESAIRVYIYFSASETYHTDKNC
jgi:hypothetical protein